MAAVTARAEYPPVNDPFQPLLGEFDNNVVPSNSPALPVNVLNSGGGTYKTVTGGEELGPWQSNPSAIPPYQEPIQSGQNRFYRLQGQ